MYHYRPLAKEVLKAYGVTAPQPWGYQVTMQEREALKQVVAFQQTLSNFKMHALSDTKPLNESILLYSKLMVEESGEFIDGMDERAKSTPTSNKMLLDGFADMVVISVGLNLYIAKATSRQGGIDAHSLLNTHLSSVSLRNQFKKIESATTMLDVEKANGDGKAFCIYDLAHIATLSISMVSEARYILHELGFTDSMLIRAIEAVNISNSLKMFTKEEKEQITQHQGNHTAVGVEVVFYPCVGRGDVYAGFSSFDQQVNGKFYPKGKLLKSCNYKEPDLEPILNDIKG